MSVDTVTKAERNGEGRSRHLVAVSAMLGATAIWAIVPLTMDYTGGVEHPFLFTGGFRIGGVIGCLEFLLFRYSNLFTTLWRANFLAPGIQSNGEARQEIRGHFSLRNRYGWGLTYAAFGKFEYVFFAYAAQVIAIYAVAVTYEIWPIVLVIVMTLLFRGEERFQRTNTGTFAMLVVCLIGFAMVVMPERTGLVRGDYLLATALVVAAAFVGGSHNAIIFKWGDVLGRKLDRCRELPEYASVAAESRDSMIMFGTVLGQCIAQFACMVLCLAIGFAAGEHLSWPLFLISIAGGALVAGMGDVVFRLANSFTSNLGVNAISYTTPIFALVWLALFSQLQIAHVDFLVVGTILIITANLLINFDAEVRWSFEVLILGLVGCGIVVYFREDVFQLFGIPHWSWVGDGYFASVALGATVFTVLLAFRVTRLVARTTDEENRTFSILRRMDSLVRRGVLNDEARRCLLAIDESKGLTVIRENYLKVRSHIANAVPLNSADRQALNRCEADLDVLVRSNQVSPVLGEIFALLVFAGITIFLTIFTRPSEEGAWLRLALDLFAMLVSAVLIFLMAYSIDLDRERDAHKLERAMVSENPTYLLVFADTEERLFDQCLSVAVGIAIILAFVALLGRKWLGWFG